MKNKVVAQKSFKTISLIVFTVFILLMTIIIGISKKNRELTNSKANSQYSSNELMYAFPQQGIFFEMDNKKNCVIYLNIKNETSLNNFSVKIKRPNDNDYACQGYKGYYQNKEVDLCNASELKGQSFSILIQNVNQDDDVSVALFQDNSTKIEQKIKCQKVNDCGSDNKTTLNTIHDTTGGQICFDNGNKTAMWQCSSGYSLNCSNDLCKCILSGQSTNTPTSLPNVTLTNTVTPTLTSTSTLSPTNTPGPINTNISLSIKLRLQGISHYSWKKQMKFKIALAKSKENIKYIDVPFDFDANTDTWEGKFNYTIPKADINQAKYFVYVKGENYLQKKICDTQPSDFQFNSYKCNAPNILLHDGDNAFDFSKVTIYAGDISQDGICDSQDLAIIINILHQSLTVRKSQKLLEKADLNLDGIVDTQDYALSLKTLAIRYGD